MLQQLLSDQSILFFATHAFLIGSSLGYLIAYKTIRSMKQRLKDQARAYDDLVNSMETTQSKSKKGNLEVIHMNPGKKKVSGYAF